MPKKKKSPVSLFQSKIILIIIAVIILLVILIATGGLNSLTAMIAQYVQGRQAPGNPLANAWSLEMQAAGYRRDAVNLQNQLDERILNAVYIERRSAAYIRNIQNTYQRQINQKRTALRTAENTIDATYLRLYSNCRRDSNCIAKVAMGQIATLTRRNYAETTHSELSITNLDCAGGIIEDGLLFRYAYAIAANNRILTTSEAGRTANQFACLSERQTFLLDKAFTRAVQQKERELQSNPQAKKLFLMHALQPILITLDSNLHLNPESLRFMEEHTEDYNSLLAGATGQELARQGIWLPDRESGKFEQFNLCNTAGCALGLDLIHSLNRRNLGVGDCTLGEMAKAGPIPGVGYACDKLICEDTFDQGKIQQVINNREEILQGQPAAIDANQQAAQQRPGLPSRQAANQPQTPQLNNEGQTQYGTSIPTTKDQICNKRRAQGRTPTGTETPTSTCGITQNSFQNRRSGNQPFQCQKPNGETKAFHGAGNSPTCQAGMGLEGLRGPDGSTTLNQNNYQPSVAAAKDIITSSEFRAAAFDGGSAVGMNEDEVEERLESAEAALENTRFVQASEMPNTPDCGPGAGGCVGPDGTLYVNTDRATTPAQQARVALHEAMHTTPNGRSTNGPADHAWMAAIEANSGGKIPLGSLVDKNDKKETPAERAEREQREREQKEEESEEQESEKKEIDENEQKDSTQCGATEGSSESCSCNPMQEKLGTLEGCRSSPRRSGVVSGGPIRDPDREPSNIGSAGTGIFSGLNSCFGTDRTRGVPRSACEATRCPENQYAVANSFGTCSCTQAGIREGAAPGRTGGGPIRDPAPFSNIDNDLGNVFRNLPGTFRQPTQQSGQVAS